MWKLIYEILVNPLGLPINPIWEYLIILLVGEIAHEIAYWISPGGKFGSFIYWWTKLITFVSIWAVLYGIILAIKFVIAYGVCFIIGGIIGLLISILLIFVFKKKEIVKEEILN